MPPRFAKCAYLINNRLFKSCSILCATLRGSQGQIRSHAACGRKPSPFPDLTMQIGATRPGTAGKRQLPGHAHVASLQAPFNCRSKWHATVCPGAMVRNAGSWKRHECCRVYAHARAAQLLHIGVEEVARRKLNHQERKERDQHQNDGGPGDPLGNVPVQRAVDETQPTRVSPASPKSRFERSTIWPRGFHSPFARSPQRSPVRWPPPSAAAHSPPCRCTPVAG